MRYACIASHQGRYPVKMMCRVLEVSRSGFYAWRRRVPSARAKEDERLLVKIRAAYRRSRERYGSPRVHVELGEEGERCGRKRVERLMRDDGLRAKKPRRFRVTTESSHAHRPAPNVVGREFSVGPRPNEVWAADLTYLPTREGWLYLSVLLDVATRKVVGWSARPRLDRTGPLAALEMALAHQEPRPGCVHHSDRGVQYACHEYRARLAEAGLSASMSRRGDCWDNAVVESFFATLKWELLRDARWQTRRQAMRELFEYLEVWYNRRRRHSSLGYLTPVEYEATLTQKVA